ncbi:S41 family peptidase [Bacteroides sp. A1-P5]|uniref:S41 family peptidase n=1 Tax=Bacteroides vicugnae TaxID=3037989 RepID=A0ABU5HM63_9BACE|nr:MULTISPECIES: S41 family peptidase [unclassified Bacteroides]MDY7252294.1 S41 family peptidase [Bacteroides sp. A1-P5]MDY7256749.1 S41 family peptidase [Bacteroides sp. A2-P53]
MKNLFNSFYSVVLLALCLVAFSNCSDGDDGGEVGGADNGITAIASATEMTVSLYGETVEISFTAAGKWSPSLQYSAGADWASITNTSGNATAGKGGLKVKVDKNESGKERVLTVAVQVEGYKVPVTVCTITQGAGSGTAVDLALNEYMDKYLKEHYLFNEEYNTLDIDYASVSYENFLPTYLLPMKTNMEDGGTYRAFSANAGKRYIYSYIMETGSSRTRANTRATSVVGSGLGTFFSSYMPDRTTIGLSIGYVYLESPAAKAGLRRGDVIVSVDGVTLNKNNYQQYMSTLFYAGGGETFKIGYRRKIFDEKQGGYDIVDGATTLTTGSYKNSPILNSMFIKDKKENKFNIGYLVYLSFDLNFEEDLKYVIQQFKAEGITDLILDLRFNNGGSVELARYLAASIAGTSHRSDVFMKMQRNSGADEYIRFGDGDDLNLNSVRIICSEETASASELIINGLRGIDFPVKLFGSRTEGKNVGMEVQEYKYGNKYYEFAPITFRSFNAKDWGDYATGMDPDVMLNNQNSDYEDDIDNVFPYAFGDWDNFDFNYPLYWALCDVQGVDPTTGEPVKRSGRSGMTRSQQDEIIRVPSVPLKRPVGTFGSLIYNKPEVENLY